MKPENNMSAQAAKTVSEEEKWNPNKPFHVTQEELWAHIHEIEKGPFIPVEECFKNVRRWMKAFAE